MSPVRIYLPSTGAAAVSPAFAAEWEDTSVAVRRAAVTTRISSIMAVVSNSSQPATNNCDILLAQYVSAPIAAGPITGTLKGQARALQGATGGNARAQIIVRVVSNDGATVRGTLYAGDLETLSSPSNPTSEWATALTNRAFPRGGAAALGAVTAQDQDRIVMEVGCRKHVALTDATYQISFGDNSATDLPEDETATATNNPWIEFSEDLFVARGGAAVRSWILE